MARLSRLVGGGAGDAVALADDEDFGAVGGVLVVGHEGEVHDDELVANLDEVSGGAVDLELARAGLAAEDVGLEAFAVAAVGDGDGVVGAHAGLGEDVGVDGDGADVVGEGGGDACLVDLAVEDFAEHVAGW